MAPKPKSIPRRLGPPAQLSQLAAAGRGGFAPGFVHQQQKFQPKMREIMAKQAKLIARWIHHNLTWKKILMSWMVLLVASKMVLLMLTYEYFTLTALISLQVGIKTRQKTCSSGGAIKGHEHGSTYAYSNSIIVQYVVYGRNRKLLTMGHMRGAKSARTLSARESIMILLSAFSLSMILNIMPFA